jgi:NAD(P)-dependent dehydrogenase (short-subunit alcohol dehydrogenase family)
MSNPVALVTGASRGIGKQLCFDLAAAGHDVVCVARSSRDNPSKLPGTVDETAAGVRERGARALAVGLDVRDEAAIASLVERVYEEWGRCDLLVNNAAVAPPRPALEDSTKRWRLAVDVNVNGPFYFTYYLAPRMAKDFGGRIVNVSSVVAVMPQFGRASYTATKCALEGMTRALGHDLADRVAVNCLRIDIPVWSEGFAETLGGGELAFEDAVVISDAILWLAREPLSQTAEVFTVTGLRDQGVVRPPSPARVGS